MKILALSGFIPEQICDIVRFTQYSGKQGIPHYCGYVSDYVSQVLEDDSIDGAVFPRSCDSTRVISSYLSETQKFLYQLNIPARQDGMAVKYLASNIGHYKNAVEKYYGTEITDIEERAEVVNIRNEKIRELYENMEEVCYYEYLKSIHEMLSNPLDKQVVPQNLNKKSTSDKRVYLVGSFLSNYHIADTIEKAGMAIVGDNLTESKRLFSAPNVEKSGNIYENIARSILYNRLSPTQNRFEEILKSDLEEMKRKNVKGVLYVTQKYCEPYDYMFSVYKKMLDENGISVLQITAVNSTDEKKMEFAMEAFADIL